MSRSTRIATAALVAAALAGPPSAAQASQTFGSQLNHEPANGPMTCKDANDALQPCTFVGYRHPTPPNGDNVPSPAPFDGVVTKLRARSLSADTVTFAFADITEQGTGNTRNATARLTALGPTVTFKGDSSIEEFDARVPVKQGSQVALNGTSNGATYDSNGGYDSYLFAPQMSPGGAFQTNSDVSGGELLVQAVIEPDADHDGFGDETQDSCPSSPAVHQGPCPATTDGNGSGHGNGVSAKDTTKPRIRGLSLLRSSVLVSVSERSRISVQLRKQGHAVKTISRSGHTGLNLVAMSRAGLAKGRYYVVVRAKDAAGNVSAARTVSFRKR